MVPGMACSFPSRGRSGMARAKQPKQIKQMTIPEWEAAFPDEDACCLYLAEHRWPEFVICPRCGNPDIKSHGTMKWNWLCNACSPSGTNYRFSHISGTIFENTNKPLRQWFRVIHLMLTSKKGISALQVYRYMGFGSYKTAWYMCHRVRAGLANEDFRKLMDIVEVDETFVGGLAKNKHIDKRGKGGGTGGIGSGKIPVVGAVQRKGKVVTRAIHTNTIEGFWSIFKRGVVGTFHKVSAKYLPLYVAEFQFRYNNRDNADIFGEAIREC